jgi:Flp pilus assembly protein TadG
MQILASLCQDRKGAAAAEMALVLPFLIALMFGAFELGHFFWSEHKVVKAVRDGARFAGRQPFTKFSCSSSNIIVGSGNNSADTTTINQIKNLTRTGNVAGSGNPLVRGWTNAQITVSVGCPSTTLTTGIYKGMANAPRVTVSAAVPYPSLFGSLGFNALSLNLNARSQAAVMGI